ncbi:MAG: porphobilinogen synthase [Chlamydiota bacterium]
MQLTGVKAEAGASLQIPTRMRRLRASPSLRRLFGETHLTENDFALPLFLTGGLNRREPISSLPQIYRYSVDEALLCIRSYLDRGVHAFALFPKVPQEKKSWDAKEALSQDSLIARALRLFSQEFPEATFIADVALDPFTIHGHDGLFLEGKIVNDATVEVLGKMACLYAEAGAHLVAPSDMMDGRVAHIRKALDQAGFSSVGILAYSAKYASSLYHPFREAVGSCLSFGDKRSYQLNPANRREAILEALLDEEEHADILLVKPASLYLDVICEIKKRTLRPVAAYHVSGEYTMVMAADAQGLLDAREVFFETLMSVKRAGADLIFSYAIDQILEDL